MRTPKWNEELYREFLELRDIIMILAQNDSVNSIVISVDPICAVLLPRYRFLKKMAIYEGKVI